MADRGYWARLGKEPPAARHSDHELGFAHSSLRENLLPRLAVLRETLETDEQREAFEEVMRSMSLVFYQVQDALEECRAMSRELKDIEDGLSYEWNDQTVARYRKDLGDPERRSTCSRFDEEAYVRSTHVLRDLKAAHVEGRAWESYLERAQVLIRKVEKWRAKFSG